MASTAREGLSLIKAPEQNGEHCNQRATVWNAPDPESLCWATVTSPDTAKASASFCPQRGTDVAIVCVMCFRAGIKQASPRVCSWGVWGQVGIEDSQATLIWGAMKELGVGGTLQAWGDA